MARGSLYLHCPPSRLVKETNVKLRRLGVGARRPVCLHGMDIAWLEKPGGMVSVPRRAERDGPWTHPDLIKLAVQDVAGPFGHRRSRVPAGLLNVPTVSFEAGLKPLRTPGP